jgi:hypothetical protein
LGHHAVDERFHGTVFRVLVDYFANLQLFSNFGECRCRLVELGPLKFERERLRLKVKIEGRGERVKAKFPRFPLPFEFTQSLIKQ